MAESRHFKNIGKCENLHVWMYYVNTKNQTKPKNVFVVNNHLSSYFNQEDTNGFYIDHKALYNI